MKFRNLLIIYIVLFTALFAVLFAMRPGNDFNRGDMTRYCNEAKAVSEGSEPPEDAAVIYLTDDDYQQKQIAFIRQGAVILDITKDGQIIGKIIWCDTGNLIEDCSRTYFRFTLIALAAAALLGLVIIILVYRNYIRPFNKLQTFAGQIAKGNLDYPLAVHKSSYFGAFTESFDIMREELKKARESEARAQKAKQEMMAELSHDIRTPLSTINATCEVIEVKSKDKDVLGKTSIIKSKAATIDSLISNMMNASLEEVTELKVNPKEESSLLINTMIENVKDLGEINVLNDIPGCLLYYDPLRLEQVIDNVVGNSVKYAGTPIDISYKSVDNGIVITISDKGPGVDQEELSLLTQKFYRGNGSSDKPGSGLGLYLAKYFMENMDGDIVFSSNNGFTADIYIRRVS